MAHIMVVDDDDSCRNLLKEALMGKGHAVNDFREEPQAFEAYKVDPPDLLITDMVMPGRNGVSLILDIRRDFPQAKIIAISGGDQNAPDNYLRLAKSLGAQRTLLKPFSLDQLHNAVEELITVPSH